MFSWLKRLGVLTQGKQRGHAQGLGLYLYRPLVRLLTRHPACMRWPDEEAAPPAAVPAANQQSEQEEEQLDLQQVQQLLSSTHVLRLDSAVCYLPHPDKARLGHSLMPGFMDVPMLHDEGWGVLTSPP